MKRCKTVLPQKSAIFCLALVQLVTQSRESPLSVTQPVGMKCISILVFLQSWRQLLWTWRMLVVCVLIFEKEEQCSSTISWLYAHVKRRIRSAYCRLKACLWCSSCCMLMMLSCCRSWCYLCHSAHDMTHKF